MIISASYKTDIPAFYGHWFLNRLQAGYCKGINPYSKREYFVSLKKEDVDGFVFWTKNLKPFMDALAIVHQQGFPFIIQYTITGYPRVLEYTVVDAQHSIRHMRTVSERYGPRVAVWRYDTILFSSVTDIDFHRDNFRKLARSLEDSTDEVVISFAQIYKKTLSNLNKAAQKFDFSWYDPEDRVKLQLATELATVARDHGMQLTMCSQRHLLGPGIEDARCVDARRLSDVAGYKIDAPLKGNRPDCGCYASRDIGEYDTCPHGCVYCYAVRNRELARKRYREHDPESEFLLFSPSLSIQNDDDKVQDDFPRQGRLL